MIKPVVKGARPVVILTACGGDAGNSSGVESGLADTIYPSGNNVDCIGETIEQQDCFRGKVVLILLRLIALVMNCRLMLLIGVA